MILFSDILTPFKYDKKCIILEPFKHVTLNPSLFYFTHITSKASFLSLKITNSINKILQIIFTYQFYHMLCRSTEYPLKLDICLNIAFINNSNRLNSRLL